MSKSYWLNNYAAILKGGKDVHVIVRGKMLGDDNDDDHDCLSVFFVFSIKIMHYLS